MATQTVSVAGGSWATGTTWLSGSAPAAGDDVVATALSGNLIIDSNTNALRSFDLTGYVGTLSGASNLVVRGANSSTVAILFAGTSNTWNGLLSITTGGTSRVYNLTSGGNTLAAITMNATSGGTLSLQDNLNCGTATITFTNGTFQTNGKTITCGVFASNNGNTRSLDISSSTVNVGSTGTIWNMATTTGLTFTVTGSTVNFTDTSASTKAINIANTAGSGIAFNAISITGSGTGALTFNAGGSSAVNFTINTPKTVKWTAATTFTVSGAFTATGTAGNIITLSSGTSTSTATLALNGTIPSPDYWSIRDITNSGSTGLTNIGNNSQGALSAANILGFYSTKTISNAGGNYNATTAWVEGIVPSSIDKIVATGTSGNLAINVNSNCFSLDLTGYVGTLSGSSFFTVNASGGSTQTVKFAGTVTWSGTLLLSMPDATTVNLTSGGKTWGSIQAGIAGTVSMQDNLTLSASILNGGTTNWLTNGFSVNALTFTCGGTSTNITNSTISLSGTGGLGTNNWVGAGTLTTTGSTIAFTNNGNSDKTFAGGGNIYNNISITGGGTGKVIFTGTNTFATFPQVTGGTKSLTWPAGVTTTITNGTAGWGNGTNILTLTSSTPTSAYTFTTAGGTVSCDYLNLTDSTAAGTVPFYAGANSTNTSNNTNWTFTAPPVGGSSMSNMALMGVG